ncbi:Gfo/Idh/MocA family oxidoreductase [Paenibacillus cremeus]|uniref:Gfo/Idh/MocA family oxidoreductase n=1 Tax=Paenibacillus cremeus TaxID=2163881 RepID=A0A559K5G2_9BACL|nr:Gfo/Idh/MocA family oxidoreductase [Paenibacillus cremeus]TVY07379.1 Gfo/Idh/MocA family oxidoreductase [Paenibacillus cremeus]
MTKYKVGIIGLGEVAQIIHLPVLESLSDRFEVTAICDISPKLLEVIGDRYRVPVQRRFTNAAELTSLAELDAVLICNSDEYHAECVISALQNRKHVLIEKPMCLTMQEADEIIRVRDEMGMKVMVGYMRRYAPAFVQMAEEVKRLSKINYVRVRDLIGGNHLFINQSSNVYRFDDIPEHAKLDRTERAARLVEEAIGEDASTDLKSAYRLLCGLGSHDLSAMRELIGFPKRVMAATQWNQGRFISAILEYDGFRVTYETGIDSNRLFDAHIQVYGSDKSLKVQYNTPYMRHLPTTLHVSATEGEAYEEKVIRSTFKDPYTCQFEAFYDVLAHDLTPKTTPEDSKSDLQLFRMLIEAMKESETRREER